MRRHRFEDVGGANVDHDVIAHNRQVQSERTRRGAAVGTETVFLDQFVDRQPPFVLGLGIDRGDRVGIERDRRDAVPVPEGGTGRFSG